MRIGIDVGGTKIEGIALDHSGAELGRVRVATPTDAYDAVLQAIAGVVTALEAEVGARCSVGVGTPGFLSTGTGRILNSNLATLNGRAVDQDLSAALGRPVRVDNDANCFVLSEATDGAAARNVAPAAPGRVHVVFGATLGTGVGGGIVIDGRVLNGANGAAGEWSHTTLPFANTSVTDDERSPYVCPCGHPRCIESFISGRGLAGAYRALGGRELDAPEVGRAAAGGDAIANRAFDLYESRLARALAGVINLIDPHVIVLGGGVSNNLRIFENVPKLWESFTAAKGLRTRLVRAQHGDASGVRGAAWLWPEETGPQPSAS
jgi:predicted NBD/HSP70 family sugar kinase